MRRFRLPRTAWLLAALFVWASVPTTWAGPIEDLSVATSPADRRSGDDPESALERGLDQERGRNWSAAIETYHKALELWPSRVDFSRRLRLCELHFKLVRRYHDASFRGVLLKLPRELSTDLYGEVLERIQNFYVDAVPFEPLIRHGLDNVEVALRDPSFLKTNGVAATPERVEELRSRLREMRAGLSIPDRDAAIAAALAASDLAGRTVGLPATPVMLEFTYGACDALDDFTSYLTPDKLEDLYAMIDGNFVGLGVELKGAPNGLRLVGVIRGGPAWEAGMVAGDQIVKIAGQTVKGLSLDDAANRLQGVEGSSVDLEVLKRDASIRSVRLIRRHVDVESVARAKIIDQTGGVGYIQLIGFQKSSAEELDQAVAGLQSLGMKTLILDLRGNPGGLLNIAVEIAERFIPEGVIVSTRGRAAGQSQVFRADGRPTWRMPVYVLVDHDSASASEILAGALQDHRRATIVGERTYGKGSVQSIFSLRSAPAGLKLTTAKFYSPRDRAYSEQGVTPDMPVKTRVVAKPAVDGDGGKDDLEESVLGDPRYDVVLAAAVRASKNHDPDVR